MIVDNGGGMDPDKMRKCMSLGYSAKSKVANTIGQCIPWFFDIWISNVFSYFPVCCWMHFECVLVLSDGNGFKTSTMRLGADVLVFSRCRGKDNKRFMFYYDFYS